MALDELDELDELEELEEFGGGGISGELLPELPQPVVSKKTHSNAVRVSGFDRDNMPVPLLCIHAERASIVCSGTLTSEERRVRKGWGWTSGPDASTSDGC